MAALLFSSSPVATPKDACDCCSPKSNKMKIKVLAEKFIPRLPKNEWEINAWAMNVHDLPNDTGSKDISNFFTLKLVFLFLPFEMDTLLAVAATCRSWRILSDRLPHWRYLLPLKTQTGSAVCEASWDKPLSTKKVFFRKNNNDNDNDVHYRLVQLRPGEKSDVPFSFPVPTRGEKRHSVWSYSKACTKYFRYDCDVSSDQDERELEAREIEANTFFMRLNSFDDVSARYTRDDKVFEEDFSLFFTPEALKHRALNEIEHKTEKEKRNVESDDGIAAVHDDNDETDPVEPTTSSSLEPIMIDKNEKLLSDASLNLAAFEEKTKTDFINYISGKSSESPVIPSRFPKTSLEHLPRRRGQLPLLESILKRKFIRQLLDGDIDPSWRLLWTYPSLSSYLNHVRDLMKTKHDILNDFRAKPEAQTPIVILCSVLFVLLFGLSFLPLHHELFFTEEVNITLFFGSLLIFIGFVILIPLAVLLHERKGSNTKLSRLIDKLRPNLIEETRKTLRWKTFGHVLMTLSLIILAVPNALLCGRVFAANHDFLEKRKPIITLDEIFNTSNSQSSETIITSSSSSCDRLPSQFLPDQNLLTDSIFVSFPSGTKFLHQPRYFLRSTVSSFSLVNKTSSSGECQVERNVLLDFTNESENVGFNNSKSIIDRNPFGYYTVILPSSSQTATKNYTLIVVSDRQECPFWSSPDSYSDTNRIGTVEELREKVLYRSHLPPVHTLRERFNGLFEQETSLTNEEIIQNASKIFDDLGNALSDFEQLFTNETFANETIFDRNNETTTTNNNDDDSQFFPDALFPCQFVNNSVVTIKDGRSVLLRLGTKWTNHWTSFYRSERDPIHEKDWTKFSEDFGRNAMIILTADNPSFFAHENTAIPVVPTQLEDEVLKNQEFLSSSTDNDRSNSLVSDYWTSAHLPGIRRMKIDYEHGIIGVSVFAFTSYFWSVCCCVFAVGISRYLYVGICIFSVIATAYPLSLMVIAGAVCDENANEKDSFELTLPSSCLFVSKEDVQFPLIYSTVMLLLIGSFFIVSTMIALKPAIQRLVRRTRARCQDLAAYVGGGCESCCRKIKKCCCYCFCCTGRQDGSDDELDNVVEGV